MIEMLQIPAGTFNMGQADIADASPVRNVTLSAFRMSRFQVTQELFEAVTGTNPSHFHGGPGREPATGEIQGRRPVEMVTWFDAVEFCNLLSEREGFTPVYTITGRTPATGYPITAATVTVNWSANGFRLPTEAEWEYACRAGSTTQWSFGDTDTNIDNYAWFSGNAGSITRQVGLKLPNAFGLYDKHGNVWEKCWDWHAIYVDAPPNENPIGPVSGTLRILRGGNWGAPAGDTRSALRFDVGSGSRNNGIGFRLVRRP